jgi:predicted nucleic acid-binding protein
MPIVTIRWGAPLLDIFLLDTDVLSNLSKERHGPILLDWFVHLHPKQFCLAMCTIFELQRGIELLRLKSPARAAAKERWLQCFLSTKPKVIQADLAITREHARLAAIPSLQNLVASCSEQGRVRYSQDLLIAATARVVDATVATFNTKDFLRIHSHARLPGLYHPEKAEWAVRTRRRRSSKGNEGADHSGRQRGLVSMLTESRWESRRSPHSKE